MVAATGHMYGLKSDYSSKGSAKRLPTGVANNFAALNTRIVSGSLPDEVLDAMAKATADKGRRDRRHAFFLEALGLGAP